MKYLMLFVLSIVAVAFAVDTVSVDTLVSNVGVVVDAARSLHVSGSSISMWLLIAAIIKLLMSLTRIVPVIKFLNSAKMKQYKPYISVVLGLLSGFTVSTVTDQSSLIANLLAGLAAGLGSIGLHETVKTVRGKNG